VVNQSTGNYVASDWAFGAKKLEEIDQGQFLELSLEVYDQGIASPRAFSRFPLYHTISMQGSVSGSPSILILSPNSACNIASQIGNNTRQTDSIPQAIGTFLSLPSGIVSPEKFNLFSSKEAITWFISYDGIWTEFTADPGNRLENLVFENSSATLGDFSLRPFPFLEGFGADDCGLDSLDFSSNYALKNIDVENNNLSGELNFSGFPNIVELFFRYNSVESVILGGDKANLTDLDFQNNQLTTAAMDSLIDELYDMRDEIVGTPTIRIGFNPGTLSADQQAKVQGTGAYAGAGLIPDYGWTVTF